AGHGLLHANLAGDPNLDGLGPHARLAAVAAVVLVVEALLEAVAKARAALDFLALVVTVVFPFLDHLGHLLVGDVSLHDGPFLDDRHALAHIAHFRLGFLDGLVHHAGARFGHALALVGGVLFLVALGLIDRALTLVRFGDPFLDADLFGRGRTGGRTRG